MQIKEITEEKIVFDNGTEITYNHKRSCCERVYPDFKHLKEVDGEVGGSLFSNGVPEDIQVEVVKDVGFRFGGWQQWFFIPCYNVQNGFYSDNLELIITYPDKTVKKIDLVAGLQRFLDA